jgi:hypothetical protein
MKAYTKPTFADVAKLIAKGPPPDWIASELARFAKFVEGPDERRTREDFLDEVALIIAIEKRTVPKRLT